MAFALVFTFFCIVFFFWLIFHCKHYFSEGQWTTPYVFKGYQSQGERRCREWLERRFQRRFDRVRPDWLRNPMHTERRNLELDCYNEELKLAVEYNGRQHYFYTPKFHKSRQDFHYTQLKDKIKKELCHLHGIRLIVVPFNELNVEAYLEKELADM